MKHKIVMLQAVFLVIIGIALYILYPKASIEIAGNEVSFKSINANVIIISENPDFSNARYIDFSRRKVIGYELPSGKYYWKASNEFIEGMKNELLIGSEVGLAINRSENESEIVNIGNVKVNVTKSKEGVMIGHIILEPEQEEKILDEAGEKYEGEQT